MRSTLFFVTVSILATFGCANPSSGKGPEDDVPVDGKLDSFRNPTDHGELDLSDTTSNRAEIKPGEWFHAWNFKLSGVAQMSIETRPARRRASVGHPGVSEPVNVDTVMYIYRQDAEGRWGRYIARNNDQEGSVFSKIDAQWDAGIYRIVVKGYQRDDVGAFYLRTSCTGGGCRGGSKICIFGDSIQAMEHSPNTDTVGERTYEIDKPETMTAEDVAVVEQMLTELTEGGINSIAEALEFEGVEGNEVYHQRLRDVFTAMEYDVWYLYAGGNSTGSIFEAVSGDKVAAIGDDSIFECTVLEPTDRWDSLSATAVETPAAFAGLEADAPAPQHVHIEGMAQGDRFSDGALASVIDAVVAVDPSAYECSAMPQGAEAEVSDRMEASELFRFLTRGDEGEIGNWEIGPSEALIGALNAYVGTDSDRIGVYQADLTGEACGGSGEGVAFIVHDESTHVASTFILVKWSE